MTTLSERVKMLGGLMLLMVSAATAGACRQDAEDRLAASGIAPVYNKQTGRLEQLVSDRNGDGKQETRAFMDGAVIKYIEIDRNADGAADRWEYYAASPNVIERAEEANGPEHSVMTRREFYAGGAIRRVVDDIDLDGRPDKWEHYEQGLLARVELDLVGKGYPSQRLVYGRDGDVIRIETDPAGTGTFKPVAPAQGK